MNRRDARKLTPEAQFEVRRQAIRLKQAGNSNRNIAQQLEVDANTVGNWIAKFRKGGLDSLKPRKRGPKLTTKLKISVELQALIRAKLIDKTPEQYRLEFALWTREAVSELIKQETGLELDRRLVGSYLKRWGFTPQRPTKRAYQRDDKKVKAWLEEQYPEIEAAAKKEGAQIQWTDEAGMKSHDHRGRGYALKGKTPIRKHNPSYEKINMISSVTNLGELTWMCYKESFTTKVFHQYLKKLIEKADGRKQYVILDNLRVHHSKLIKRWARRYPTLIELKYLPSYSPDLNPDEYFNCDLKTELSKRPERRTKGKWSSTVTDCLVKMEDEPLRVKSYFKSKHIAYAA
jgi:transposase